MRAFFLVVGCLYIDWILIFNYDFTDLTEDYNILYMISIITIIFIIVQTIVCYDIVWTMIFNYEFTDLTEDYDIL